MEKAQKESILPDPHAHPAEIFEVEKLLYKFPEVVETAALNYQPHLICNFLFDLAQKFNSFYNNVPILDKGYSAVILAKAGIRNMDSGSTPGMTSNQFAPNFRLSLTTSTAQVLKNGLYLLGLEAPERM